MLQRAGVPAGPVLANWELVSNPHLHARGFYVPVEHPDMGVFPYPGMPWKLSETPGQIRAASPLFGQHTRQIFQDLLGLRRRRAETSVRRMDHRRRASPRPPRPHHTLPPNLIRSPRAPHDHQTKPAPSLGFLCLVRIFAACQSQLLSMRSGVEAIKVMHFIRDTLLHYQPLL